MPDRLTELVNHTAVLNHLVHQLWMRDFARCSNPIADATDYINQIRKALETLPESDFPEAASDMRDMTISFFETVLAELRMELEQGRLDA